VKVIALPAAVGYIAAVVLANVLTEHFGLVPIGFGLFCTAGTFAAGAALLTRNVTQDLTGRLVIVGLMLIGCGLSWWLASPALAVASAVAFTLSETVDMAVYSPLRDRGWSRAVMAASLASAIVDTYVFLAIAGFPITTDTVAGQLVVKIGISWAVAVIVAGGSLALLRQSVDAEGA
jgi:queuosine precursor transporter